MNHSPSQLRQITRSLISYSIPCTTAVFVILLTLAVFSHCRPTYGLGARGCHILRDDCPKGTGRHVFGSRWAEEVMFQFMCVVATVLWILQPILYRESIRRAFSLSRICLSQGVPRVLPWLQNKWRVMRVSTRVHFELQQKRMLFAKKMLQCIRLLLLVLLTLLLFHATNVPHVWDYRTFHSLIFPFFCVCVVCTALSLSDLNPLKLDCANIVLSCMWAWRYLNTEDYYYQYHSGNILVCRFGSGLMLGNARLTIALQLILTTVESWMYFYHFVNECDPDSLRQFLAGYLPMQIVILASLVALTLTLERWMISHVEALVEAKRSHQSTTRIRRLLSGMCDAVVELDANSNLVGPCPKLGHMLLHGTAEKMTKTPFSDLVTVADQERFQNYISHEIESHKIYEPGVTDLAPPSALHVHLLDVNSTPVAVQIFTTYCHDVVDGDHTLLIGLVFEEGKIPYIPDNLSSLPFHDHVRVSKHESNAEICSASDCTSGSMVECAVVCSVFSKGMPIESCTVAFASLCGSGQIPKGMKLLDILVQPDAFKTWAQTCVNDLYSDSKNLVDGTSIKKVAFHVIGNSFVELVCTCRIDIEHGISDILETGLARFMFEDVSVRRKAFKHKIRRPLGNWVVEL